MSKGGAVALIIIAVGAFLLVAGAEEESVLFVYGALFLLSVYLGVKGSRWWLVPAGLQVACALAMFWLLSLGH